ncbi:hypothetical protein BpHYR1_034086 [Brachionus plicatilis]|uniref:Uncharacterized protein n=1 Tax=Brachionus plicatilis TaxID=10195 RepID=A0A3M7PK15_BRAPC|nr:hypothetical protein BpHYR1_034086 [Brachionus plicatilis]
MAEEDTKRLIDQTTQIIDSENQKIAKSKNLAAQDSKQMNNFLGPMMKELEDAVAEQMKYLDKIEEDLMEDSKLEEYNRLVGHIPKEIRGSKSILAVFKNLGTILNETVDDDKVPSELIEKSIKERFSEIGKFFKQFVRLFAL